MVSHGSVMARVAALTGYAIRAKRLQGPHVAGGLCLAVIIRDLPPPCRLGLVHGTRRTDPDPRARVHKEHPKHCTPNGMVRTLPAPERERVRI